MAGRPRDDRARAVVLRKAADIASLEGLSGMSIGRLAGDLGVSKSGLFGYFGSKEELQLATIRMAAEVYTTEVIRPALAVTPGLDRVWRLCECWLGYSQRRVFPGGCFFFAVNAEFDGRPGRVREALADASLRWNRFVAAAVEDARRLAQVHDGVDADQVAFELIAFMETANALSMLHDDATGYTRARTAIATRLRDISGAAWSPPSPG